MNMMIAVSRLSPAQVRSNLLIAAKAKNIPLSTLSKAINKNPSYLHQFLHRETPRKLHEADRSVLARLLEVTEHSLGGAAKQLDADATEASGLSIPVYDVTASAGPGRYPEETHAVIGTVHLPYGMVPRLKHLKSAELSIVSVQGESMHPTLRDGDHVLIDASQQSPHQEGLYLLRIDNHLYVKRLLIHPGTQQLTVKSDNPLFDEWPNVDPQDLSILGRVIWAGCNL